MEGVRPSVCCVPLSRNEVVGAVVDDNGAADDAPGADRPDVLVLDGALGVE